MASFEEYTRLGRLRKMRQAAQGALADYGLENARLDFLRYAGNTLYRVYEPTPATGSTGADLFEPGQYLLRIYRDSYPGQAAIELEVAWLAAMRCEADLPVPEPILSREGKMTVPVTLPGTNISRTGVLYRWVKGRYLNHPAKAQHYRAQGRLMGRMHRFASQWQTPPGSAGRNFDWEGLFMNEAEIGLARGEAWKHLAPEWCQSFEIVTRQFQELELAWGKGPGVYGLIHSDMGLDANVLFWHGEARLIDFEAAGFGYWMYDLAVAVEHCREDPDYSRYLAALLEGYTEYQDLPAGQLAMFDLFQAAYRVYFALWAVGVIQARPETQESLQPRLDREMKLVREYVTGHGKK